MKRTNLVNKSVKLLMSIIIASSVVAMGSNGTVAATLTNNDAIISSIVMAAESTPLPKQWSTAEVYKDARYGETWSGPLVIEKQANNPTKDQGTDTKWEWLNDMSYVFSVAHAVTDNGTVLDYQWLQPVDMTQCGTEQTYVSYTDNNEPIRKYFTVESIGFPEEGETFQNCMTDMISSYQISPYCSEVGVNHLNYQEDDLTCRFTFNITRTYESGLILKGYVSYVQNKSTQEVYRFRYTEHLEDYDDTRALTVIYSCLPVVQK